MILLGGLISALVAGSMMMAFAVDGDDAGQDPAEPSADAAEDGRQGTSFDILDAGEGEAEPLPDKGAGGILDPDGDVPLDAEEAGADQAPFADEDAILDSLEDADIAALIDAWAGTELPGDGGGSGAILSGTAGDDILTGGALTDILGGGAGDDALRGAGDDDSLVGDAGNDTLIGEDGNDTLAGGDGFDRLAGGAGDDALFAGAGGGAMTGGQGADVLQGGLGRDAILGGADDDQLFGREGADRLIGGDGTDTMQGGSGDDLIIGLDRTAPEADFLNGSAGDDTLVLDLFDTATGGDGADTFILGYAPGDGPLVERGADGPSQLLDFDAAEDQLIVLYDDSVAGTPSLELRSSARADGVMEVVVDGAVISELSGDKLPARDDIVLMGEGELQGLLRSGAA